MHPRRADAGFTSLIDRAYLNLTVVAVEDAQPMSPYGDTDQRVAVTVGDEGPREYGRCARVEGVLVLHRTVGGRARWRWDPEQTRLTVWSRSTPGVVESATFAELEDSSEAGAGGLLLERVVGELAAQAVEQLLGERAPAGAGPWRGRKEEDE